MIINSNFLYQKAKTTTKHLKLTLFISKIKISTKIKNKNQNIVRIVVKFK